MRHLDLKGHRVALRGSVQLAPARHPFPRPGASPPRAPSRGVHLSCLGVASRTPVTLHTQAAASRGSRVLESPSLAARSPAGRGKRRLFSSFKPDNMVGAGGFSAGPGRAEDVMASSRKEEARQEFLGSLPRAPSGRGTLLVWLCHPRASPSPRSPKPRFPRGRTP